MKFITHPAHNCYMGAPRDWDAERDGPCGALSICDMRDQSLPKMESAWELEGFEDVAMLLGAGTIRLGIIGTAHPPVYMFAAPKGFASEAAKRNAYTAALAKLVEHAKANGVILKIDGNAFSAEPA